MMTTLKTLAIAGAGGLVHYLYQYLKGEKFDFAHFLVNILIASFVGYIVGEFILPGSTAYRDGLICIAGVSALEIMATLENKGSIVLGRFLKLDKHERK